MPFFSFIANITHRLSEKAASYTKAVLRWLKAPSFKWSVINVAWTAGPVTYIALVAGSYMGYGKPPEYNTLIYFAGYALVAGVLAIVVQMIAQIFYLPKQEEKERFVSEAIDTLFMLYFAARNAYLKTYPEEERALVASWWALRSSAAGESRLEEAVYDITGDRELAQAMKRIEYYNRQGLSDALHAEYRVYAQRIIAETEKVASSYPGVASYLLSRFKGDAPSQSAGQPRTAGFIERVIVADERNDASLTVPEDAEAAIHLALECLLGRSFLILDPRFKGHKKLERAKDKLDTALSDYRLIRRRRNSRIRALTVDLSSQDDNTEFSARGAGSAVLGAALTEALKRDPSVLRDPSVRARYERIIALNAGVKKILPKVFALEKAYNKIWKTEGEHFAEKMRRASSPDARRSPLAIDEKEIALNSAEKVRFAEHILQATESFTVRPDTVRAYKTSPDYMSDMEIDGFTPIAASVINGLDDILNITEPDIQLAIEEAHEADFGFVEPRMPASVKIAHGETAVKAIQQNRSKTAIRLARRLAGYFNIPLGDGVIAYLSAKYDAPESALTEAEYAGAGENDTPRLKSEILYLPSPEALERGLTAKTPRISAAGRHGLKINIWKNNNIKNDKDGNI